MLKAETEGAVPKDDDNSDVFEPNRKHGTLHTGPSVNEKKRFQKLLLEQSNLKVLNDKDQYQLDSEWRKMRRHLSLKPEYTKKEFMRKQ